MLTPSDLALIVATAVVCTALVSGLGALAMRRLRGAPIGVQLAVVMVAAVTSIALGVLAVMIEMYVEPHAFTVVVWVLGVSGVLSTAAAWWLVARPVRASVRTLSQAARRLADGEVLPPDGTGDAAARELAELSAELSETSARLAAARAEIEQLDTARRDHIAWISHDLRTPLAGLRALTEALEAGVAPDPQEYLRSIRGRVDTLSAMVEDLFALSRIQAGALHLRRETVALLDLVSDAVADVMPVAGERGIRIVPSGVEGVELDADPRELTRAIANLLSNGVRHSPPGGEIVVSATRDGDHLVLSVQDQGPGVQAEELERMFEVGWRADPSRGGGTGAGLGLAIVRGIAEAHGGEVRADRVPDGFRLDLVLPRTGPALTS